MALAHVTFIRYYQYEVEVDDDLYEDAPWEAEEKAIEEAEKEFHKLQLQPIADTTYDEAEVEFE